MGEFEQVQAAIESQRRKVPDYSCELPGIIDRLSALGQLMFVFCEYKIEPDLKNNEISGVGMLINDIADKLKEINHGLYGERKEAAPICR